MDLLLIRHGETAWNRVRRMQGHIDIPLNEVGQRQAQALGDALSVVPVQAVYASDLQRARDTAQAVANSHALTVNLHTSLRERCYMPISASVIRKLLPSGAHANQGRAFLPVNAKQRRCRNFISAQWRRSLTSCAAMKRVMLKLTALTLSMALS